MSFADAEAGLASDTGKLLPGTRRLVVAILGAAIFVGLGFYLLPVSAVAVTRRRMEAAMTARALTLQEEDRRRIARDFERLTPRERQILQLVAEGGTNRRIADRLQLSPKTVDVHRTSLMRKLDLHSAQALTRYALRRGLISPS